MYIFFYYDLQRETQTFVVMDPKYYILLLFFRKRVVLRFQNWQDCLDFHIIIVKLFLNNTWRNIRNSNNTTT